MKKLIVMIVAGCLMQNAYAENELDSESKKLSYTIGVQIGSNLQQTGGLDVDAVTLAIEDVLSGKDLKLSPEEMQTVMRNFQEKKLAEQMESSMDNRKAGKTFLEENKKKEGVIETASGLQYKVLQEGDGKQPSASSDVEVHYHGKTIDGNVFDSSVERGQPIVLNVGQVIKGWQEALPMMKEGSKWQLYIPSDLAYGERGAGGAIGPNETLIFDVELISIK